jgi:NAD(P) transhydrogenase
MNRKSPMEMPILTDNNRKERDQMPVTKEYDLIVLGGGPAGVVGTGAARTLNKSTALVDNEPGIGGAGINTGTVPSKTLRETAVALSGMRSRNLHGVDLSLRRQATVADFLHHEQEVRDGLSASLSQRLGDEHADRYVGFGEFVDAHTIRIHPTPPADAKVAPPEDILLRGERILIATGSSPRRPEMFPFDSDGVYDSDTILQLNRIPRTMAVIGAGTIGCEYACTFAALGVQVHLIDGRNELFPFLDAEISARLHSTMERNGIQFHWKKQVENCVSHKPDGVTLHLSGGETLTVDEVLVAAGRQSNTGKLNLPAAGVKTGDHGLIPVDEHFRTNVEHIYAAGDVIGFPALASTSMEQARRAVLHAFGHAPHRIPRLLPNGIYTIPEISTVGETEESLKKAGINYIAGRSSYWDVSRGRIIGDKDGFLKLLFRQGDMKLLGVHIIGELATEVVHVGLMAMLTDSTVDLFLEACFNVPTLATLYKLATIDAVRQSGVRA